MYLRWRPYAHMLAILVVLATGSLAFAQDKYYVMIFATDSNPPTARAAHSYATFLKVSEKNNKDPKPPVEVRTISWMPASIDIKLLAPPEQGVNLDLAATLKLAKAQNGVVSMWGPFEIRKELYDRAGAQIERLKSGKIGWKALDRRFRPDGACNCFHAISDIMGGPLLDTGTAFGAPASEMVMQHLTPLMIEPTKLHREVLKGVNLGLEGVTMRDEVPRIVEKR
jgi:hypothetical protein